MEFKNDLGKPWKFQDGDFTVIRSSVWISPGLPPVGAGIKLYVDKDGRLDHVEGDENDPITQGRLCPRCVALKDYIYNPSRVIYPQKRAKEERGNADAWERCSWDEALDIIMDNWRRLTDEYGRETMAIFVGTGRDGHALPGLPAVHLPHAQPGLHPVRLRLLPAAHDVVADGARCPVPRA